MHRLSAVVSVRDRDAAIAPLVRALLGAGREHGLTEIVVVRPPGAPLAAELPTAHDAELTWVDESLPGAAAAWNRGAERASGERLLLLDRDCLPDHDALHALEVYGALHPDADVVGSRIVGADDRIWHAGVVIGQDDRPHALYAGFPESHAAVRRSRRLQATLLDGAVIRREAFLACGALDTRLPSDWAALDFCTRVAPPAVHVCHDATWRLLAPRPAPFRGEPTAESGAGSRFAGLGLDRDDLDHYVADGLLGESYPGPHPSRWSISSTLATVDRTADRRTADRLLEETALRIRELIAENDRFRRRLEKGRE